MAGVSLLSALLFFIGTTTAHDYGCFVDQPNRSFPHARITSGAMTNAMCKGHCRSKGFPYSATEYSYECFCGAAEDFGILGPAKADLQCNHRCRGNPNEFCGGQWRMMVSSTEVYIGCFQDMPHRLFPHSKIKSQTLTNAQCAQHCKAEGYDYSATQYSFECFCGTGANFANLGQQLPDGQCNRRCKGNSAEFCGGAWRLSVSRVSVSPESHACQVEDGTSYRGTVAVTRTSRTCQRWDSQTPHEHDRTPAKYPSSGLEQNYCRNPDGTSGVWCYTTDPDKRWELCDVPLCGASPRGKKAGVPLGMQSGAIPNRRITASSNWDRYHMSYYARLNRLPRGRSTGGWSARHNNRRQWLQVDLGKAVQITGTIIQGRAEANQWVRSYKLGFSNDGRTWKIYRSGNGSVKVFPGNKDRNTSVTNLMDHPVNARYVRFYPQSWHGHISMRVEVLGLPGKG